jgi:hypothetical protein
MSSNSEQMIFSAVTGIPHRLNRPRPDASTDCKRFKMKTFQIIPFGRYLQKDGFLSRDGVFDKIGGGWNLLGLSLWQEALSGIFGELV